MLSLLHYIMRSLTKVLIIDNEIIDLREKGVGYTSMIYGEKVLKQIYKF